MLTSRQNPLVQDVRALARKRSGDRFLIEGPIVLGEALDAGLSVTLALVSADFYDPVLERLEGTRVERVSPELLAYVADTEQPRGIVAAARVPVLAEWPDPSGRILALDELRDPGNVGSIVRTACAAGASAVALVGKCVDPWSPKVVRAAAGALFRVPIVQFADRAEFIKWAGGTRLVAAAADADQTCFDADLSAPIIIVLGSEAHGVHPSIREHADAVRIPMAADTESLNVAAAAAVLLYQAVQQEHKQKAP